MHASKNITTKIASVLLPLAWISQSMAGNNGGVGAITHAPFSTAVPGLSGLALIVLALLLAVVAVRFLRGKSAGANPLLVGATLVTALAVGGSGIKLVSDANAVIVDSINMELSSGGTVIVPFPGYWQINNVTGIQQKLTSIEVDPGCFISEVNGGNAGSDLGNCEVGLNMGDDDYCYINVYCEICGPQGGDNGGGCCGPQGGGNGGCEI